MDRSMKFGNQDTTRPGSFLNFLQIAQKCSDITLACSGLLSLRKLLQELSYSKISLIAIQLRLQLAFSTLSKRKKTFLSPLISMNRWAKIFLEL